jgi:serine/threonine protein kinase
MTVFVSYSSRDRDAVKNLTQDLQDAEEQVWMDQRLAGGDAWWRAILEQIRGCDVFIFALSQNSIQSKPCQAELHYAQALGLPILPVQVGPVDSMQLNPLATVQTINYSTPTPSTAMRLISALNRKRAQRQPLPSPLPDEPEVPFEYLIRLYAIVADPDQLSPRDQAALVAQLQVGLREDGDHDAARNDIVTLLTKLRDREDVTYRTRTDVEAILASIDSQSATPLPSVANPAPPTSATEPAAQQQAADLNLAATPLRPRRRLTWPLIAPAAVDGTPFGRYRLIRLLGRGGMGEVWRAHDTSTNRIVAIKLLPPHLAQDDTFVTRFRREAEAAAQLNSPHIIPIHDYGEIDGRLYVNMRLIEGRDLQQVLADGPIDPARAVRIIEQVAKALQAAHKIGLVHRDVKPSNILLDKDDFAYLIDFGIARATEDTRLTGTGSVIGSWPYMSPERLRAGQVDARSDIYALACVLHQCLTGQLPFPGDSPEQVAAAHMLTPPPKPSTQQPGVPNGFDDVIARGMAKDPDRRYGTALELAGAAHKALALAAGADTMHAETPPHAKQAPTADTADTLFGNFGDFVRQTPPSKPAKPATPPSKPAEPATPAHSADIRSGATDVGGHRSRWPTTAGAIVVILLLSAVAFILRPWQHNGPTNGPTSTPTSVAPSMTYPAMRDFVTAYYNDLPSHPDDAWAKIDTVGKNETGYEKFSEFWRTIQSVTVVSVSPRDATSVIARLRYVRRTGQSDTEDRWLRMALVNGVIMLEESGRIGTVNEAPTTSTTTTSTTTSTTTIAPPRPPFAERDLEGLLLSPDQINTAMGATGLTVSSTTSARGYDDSAIMPDKACLPMSSPVQSTVLAGSGWSALRGQALQQPPGDTWTLAVKQDVVLFSSAHDADAFFTASAQSWPACSNRQYTYTEAGKPDQLWTVGPVSNTNGTLSATKTQVLGEGWTCQRALTVAKAVAIDVEACTKSDTPLSGSALNIAQQIAAKVPT